MRRLTGVLFGHTFHKLTLNHKTLRCEARDVSNAKADLTLGQSHVSLGTCTAKLQTNMFSHTACVTKFTL